MWFAKRFWTAYTLVSIAWLLTGVSVAAVHFTNRPMPRDAQLALRGGGCVASGGTCSSTCNAPDGDCSKSETTTCTMMNDPCDTPSVPKGSTGLNNVCGGTVGATGCATSVPTALCYNIQACYCDPNDNGGFNCADGGEAPDNEPVCIQGAQGQPN